MAGKKGGKEMPDNGEIPGVVKVLFSILIAVAFGAGWFAINSRAVAEGGFIESSMYEIFEKVFEKIFSGI